MKINNRFINKIIKHYLKYDKDNPFIFISSLLAFLGIAAGVMVLMLAMGIMHGTQKEFQKRLFVMNYPITLISTSYSGANINLINSLKKEFPNIKFSPYYTTQVITKSGSSVNGSILYGIDFKKEAEINEVFRRALDGSISSQSRYKMVTGEVLAKEMGVYKGQKLTLYFSEQQAIGFGTMPLQKRFVIDSTFDSGLKAYDKAIIYATLDSFQKILKRKEGIYDGVHIYSKDASRCQKNQKVFSKKCSYSIGNSRGVVGAGLLIFCSNGDGERGSIFSTSTYNFSSFTKYNLLFTNDSYEQKSRNCPYENPWSNKKRDKNYIL